MPSHEFQAIADIQNHVDERQWAIQKVGIKSIRHPIHVLTETGAHQPTVATFDMFVNLTADKKGTHMSRFVELIHDLKLPLSFPQFKALLQDMTERLEADRGYIDVQFPFFVPKAAPVSGAKSYIDYEIKLNGEWAAGQANVFMSVIVPVTTLCPCSKAISKYGAHNQRSEITVRFAPKTDMPFETVIRLVEKQASCELFGILKRADEKYVTEKAYENPKFVEDMVRDIAQALKNEPNIQEFSITSENFESIHNHSAYAYLEGN